MEDDLIIAIDQIRELQRQMDHLRTTVDRVECEVIDNTNEIKRFKYERRTLNIG